MSRALDAGQLDALAGLLRAGGYTAVLVGIRDLALEASRARPGGDVALEAVARSLRESITHAAVAEHRA